MLRSRSTSAKKDRVDASAPAASALPDRQLPRALRGLYPAERDQLVEQKRQQRDALRREIDEATKKRDAYRRDSAPRTPDSSFDSQVVGSLKRAASQAGVPY